MTCYDAVVVGGGFFGASLALHLQRTLKQRVSLLEMGSHLLGRASFVNQARVHGGYHYPRSILTGLRSQVNYPRFVAEFRDCVDSSFTKYYAIGRSFSKVTASQFRLFCERIGAPLEKAPESIKRMFAKEFIEEVFVVRESAFDAVRLRQRMHSALLESGVEVWINSEAQRVYSRGTALGIDYLRQGEIGTMDARQVFNCTYSRINKLLNDSGLSLIPLKHELAEITLIDAPPALQKSGLTVMCGPFFSIMPFPARHCHSLTHVRYTPHYEWHTDIDTYQDPYRVFDDLPKESNFMRMIKDAQRYLPLLGECRYRASLWEIKTVLPRSEVDDSRPILLKRDHGLTNLHCVTGAKLDNVYDILEFFSLPEMGTRDWR